jgi:hypothetical protein
VAAAAALLLHLLVISTHRDMLLLLHASSCFQHCCFAAMLLLLPLLLVLQDMRWEVFRSHLLAPCCPPLLRRCHDMHMPRRCCQLGCHFCLLPRVLLQVVMNGPHRPQALQGSHPTTHAVVSCCMIAVHIIQGAPGAVLACDVPWCSRQR